MSDKYIKTIKCVTCQNDFITSKYKNSKFCSKKCQFYRPITLTDIDLSILEGSLISDGSILKAKNNVNYQFKHSCKYFEYVNYIHQSLSFTTNVYSMKTRDIHTLCSQFSYVFTELRQKWYKDGTKIIPKSLNITPVLLLHWYLGDGNLNNKHGITLCTDCFSEADIQDVIFNINQKYNLQAYYRPKSKRIIIPNKYVFEFLKLIGKPPVYCYNYKWDTKIKFSYFHRKCQHINCNNFFDAEQNHQLYCNEKCYKLQWNIDDKN